MLVSLCRLGKEGEEGPVEHVTRPRQRSEAKNVCMGAKGGRPGQSTGAWVGRSVDLLGWAAIVKGKNERQKKKRLGEGMAVR